MNFKTKRRYKFLSRFFAVSMFASMIIGLTICIYSLAVKRTTHVEMANLIPYMIAIIIVMLISSTQHTRFTNKLENYLRSIKNYRQENWQKVIITLADNNELDKAMTLYGALIFKDAPVKFYLEGYLTALDRNKKEE